MPLVLQTSEDIWTDQLTFNDLYEFDRTTILNADGSFTIDHQQSGSGDSAFDHVGSGSSDDADETTPAETYQHHVWENSDYSYMLSATIASIPADSEGSTGSNDPQAYNTGDPSGSGNTQVPATARITDFSYVLHFLKKRRAFEIGVQQKRLNHHVVVCNQTTQWESQGWSSIGHRRIGING